MPDREKVIKGLEACIPLDEGEKCPTECPYYRDVCSGYSQVMRDALALLKEPETIEPTDLGLADFITWGCPICDRWLDHDYKYCPYCGRKVKWDG